MKVGEKVNVVDTLINGEVSKVKFDEDTGEKRIWIEWTDKFGQGQEREFRAEDLTLIPASE